MEEKEEGAIQCKTDRPDLHSDIQLVIYFTTIRNIMQWTVFQRQFQYFFVARVLRSCSYRTKKCILHPFPIAIRYGYGYEFHSTIFGYMSIWTTVVVSVSLILRFTSSWISWLFRSYFPFWIFGSFPIFWIYMAGWHCCFFVAWLAADIGYFKARRPEWWWYCFKMFISINSVETSKMGMIEIFGIRISRFSENEWNGRGKQMNFNNKSKLMVRNRLNDIMVGN